MPATYPQNPVTVGEHIRKKRMKLKLFQRDVAKILKVSEDCITNWENNRGTPQINHFPKIIEFLGYIPLEIDTSTLVGKLNACRYRSGFSQGELAKAAKVDAGTMGMVLNEGYIPTGRIFAKLEHFAENWEK